MQVPRPPKKHDAENPLWKELSVEPFQLMKLTREHVPHSFKAGDIVSLSDDVRMDIHYSPPKHPGQRMENVNMDSIASVKIYKWTVRETAVAVRTLEGGSIQHAHLVDPNTNKVGENQWELKRRVKVLAKGAKDYTTATYPAYPVPGGKRYPIPDKTEGIVRNCETPTGVVLSGRGGGTTGTSARTLSISTYVVEFTMLETEHVWVACDWHVPISHLAQLTPAEMATEKTHIGQTAGRKTRALVSHRKAGVTFPGLGSVSSI